MKLPIGIQSFDTLRSEGYLYVDKTAFIDQLVGGGGRHYFLSRPRRFGKSLFLDTLHQAFSGRREFFKGLYLEDHWDWDACHPVVHLSFGAGVMRTLDELREWINYRLDTLYENHRIPRKYPSVHTAFTDLIARLCQQTGNGVVVLIDEYDKPILDNIDDPGSAKKFREELKNLYSVIKDSERQIRFSFITGVSKFSKVSLFSGLNNLMDITLDPRYGAICGWTESETEAVFRKSRPEVDPKKARLWYNGYNFLGESVYNPFDLLLYLDSGRLKNYWFESGTPTFLVRLLHQRQYAVADLETLETAESLLGSFDVDAVHPETLLFQTGYLTIDEKIALGDETIYRLRYPNREVKKSLADALLTHFTGDPARQSRNAVRVYRALETLDMEGLKSVFQGFFASIPYDWYRKNRLSEYEGYYASIVYCYFAALGLDVTPEDHTHKGRIDLTIRFQDRVFLLEFKVVELSPTGNALAQLKTKNYHEKYADRDVYLIGIEFSSEHRQIVRFEWEKGR